MDPRYPHSLGVPPPPLVGNQNPHTAPPGSAPAWNGDPQLPHGIQASQIWQAGDRDPRGIIDVQTLAGSVWRVSVFGTRVKLSVEFGTSRRVFFENIRTPMVLYLPGRVIVTATPLPTDEGIFIGASAQPTCTPSTGGRPSARYLIGGAQAIPDTASRFRATDAATVLLGGVTPITLAASQSIPLIAGSSLTAGDGYVEFEG